MDEPIYVESIMTIVFTSSGNIVLTKNKKGELDTVPQYFLGRKEAGSKGYNEETNIGVINDLIDYEEEIDDCSSLFGTFDCGRGRRLGVFLPKDNETGQCEERADYKDGRYRLESIYAADSKTQRSDARAAT